MKRPPAKWRCRTLAAEAERDGGRLSHVDEAGRARMVDVGGKAVTERVATAEGFVSMRPQTLALIRANSLQKGDVLAAAELAGVMAAKRTSDLIPLCHPLPLTSVRVELEPQEAPPGVRIRATAKCSGKTGVEMEALTAVSIAALTVYDMAKAVDRGMQITEIRLRRKTGGRSGDVELP